MLVLLPIEHLRALMVSCSKEETRYYLQGVFVDPTGFAVTTDGHRMTIVSLTGKDKPNFAGCGEGIIIPRESIDKLLKLVNPKYDSAPIAVRFDGVAGSVTHEDVSIAFKPIDGTFPDWRRVMPAKDANEAPGHYNPAYLADIEKQAKLLGGGFAMKQDPVGPSEIWFNDDAVRAILMPARAGVAPRLPVSDWVSKRTVNGPEKAAA